MGEFKYNVTSYPLPQRATGVALGDFNRDGLPDFVVASDASDRRLIFMRNNGNGIFTSRVLGVVPGAFVEAADLNKDGKLDVVTPNGPAPIATSLKTLLGNGDGTFRRGPDVAVTDYPYVVRPGDYDNDAAIDLAILECGATCQLVLLLGNGDATYHIGSVRTVGENAFSMTSNDFNRDGKLDVAVAVQRPSRVVIYFGDGMGSFSSSTTVVLPNPFEPEFAAESFPSVEQADFNDDGIPDLVGVAGSNCGSACGTSTGSVFLNNGSGAFTLKSTMSAAGTGGSAITPFDYNNDFKQDIIFWNGGHFDGGFRAYQGRGDGTFASTTSNFTECCEAADFAPRDLNLDSRHDLVGANWLGKSVEVGINTNNTFNCPPPASSQIIARICKPANNGSVPGSFEVRASGNSPAGVKRLELWVDGTKRYQTWNDQMRRTISLGAGAHRVTVVAVDQYVGSAKAIINVNVQ
jgi:hypothetical protein